MGVIDDFVRAIDVSFNERVVCLVFFGSQRYKRSKIGSDYDLYLVLDSHIDGDLIKLSKIASSSKLNLDPTLQYFDQLPADPNRFQDGSMGCFALDYLSEGKPLLGTNIFIDYKKSVTYKEYKLSLLRKINEYAHRFRKELITRSDLDYLMKFSEKYLARTVIDICLYFRFIDLRTLKTLPSDEVIEITKEVDWFDQFKIRDRLSQSEGQELVSTRHQLFEEMYSKFISEIK